MSDPQVLNTLDAKRVDIEGYIKGLERDLEQARRDLCAILAAIKVFSGKGEKVTAYMNLAQVFPRNELPRRAREALEAHPDGITTTAIAELVMIAKGMDVKDRHLRSSITYKLVCVLRRWERERKVVRTGKAGAALIWRQTIF